MIRGTLAALVMLATMSGLTQAETKEETNLTVCKRFYAELNKGNLKIIDELVADTFVEHEVLPGHPANREGLKQFFTAMRAAFPDLTMDVDFYMADGDKVAAYLTLKGTHKGEFMGMAATGNKISVKTVDIIRVENGKAVEHWGVTDGLAMMDQLDAGTEEAKEE